MSQENKRMNKRRNPLQLDVKPSKEGNTKKVEATTTFDPSQGSQTFMIFLRLNKALLSAYKELYPNDSASELLQRVLTENLKTNYAKTYARLVESQTKEGI
jgi:hypothetical protein